MEVNLTTKDDVGGGGAHDFRQLGILREFSNIANAVSDEEFLRVMPTKRLKNVKWLQLLKVLRERMQLTVTEDWETMWEEEGLAGKLEALEHQREKYTEESLAHQSWRPELANVKAQLKGIDAMILLNKKYALAQEAQVYESRVAKLKNTILAKRSYLRALALDMQKCQKKNNELCQIIDEYFVEHSELAENICPSLSRDDYESGVEIEL